MVKTGCVPQTKNPDYPFLDTARPATVAAYLTLRNLLQPQEHIRRIDSAGPDPRNATWRVVTNARSFILKHFREWTVNGRVPPPAADRFRAESQFNRAVRISDCVGRAVPGLLHQDARSGCLLYEDLGRVSTSLRRSPSQAESLAWFLVSMHHHSQSVPAAARYRSEPLVQWHVQRLFGDDNGSFQASRRDYRWRSRLASAPGAAAGMLQKARGALESTSSSLVHGDFTPDNWIHSGDASSVVDAEFSFFGRPEFDVGALLAGLLVTRQPAPTIDAALGVIARGCFRYDQRLVAAFAAAQLCAMLDERVVGDATPKGSSALALYRRTIAAIETGALEALARR
jgi:5-methylthioribose kinase